MISSRLIKSNNTAAGCVDIVDAYDPFGGNGVALYQLNGNANDVSGNYNGTATNVTYGTGVFGQAGVFSNNVSRSVVEASINLGSVKTISHWVKFSQFQADNIHIFSSSSNNLQLVLLNGTRQFAFYDGVSTKTFGSFFPNDFIWHHLVWIINGTSTSLYLDGTLVTTIANASNTQSDIVIGSNSGISGVIGSIDQVRIFNTALDPLEVEALYTEELCICDGTVDTLDILGDTSCIATYQLDGNANDLSGNYSGQATDVSYGVGEFDLAGVFNGSSSKVSTSAYGLSGNASYSASLWFKLGDTSGDQVLYGLGNQAVYQASAIYIRNNNEIFHANVGNADFFNSIPTLSAGVWYHFVFTYSSSNTAKIYINGSQIGTSISLSQGGLNLTGNIGRICCDTYDGNFLNGSIDQVRIFNKALNSTEVTTLYNETACATETRTAGDLQILGDSSCIANYRLDGDTTDLSGNYNASINLPNYTNGDFDFALLSTPSTVMTAPASLVGQNHSVSMWINPNSTSGAFYPYGQFVGGASGRFFANIQNGYLGVGIDTSVDYVTTTNPLILKQWNHVVWIKDSTYGWYFYVNNILAGQVAATNNIYTGTNTTFGTFANVDGSIDQIRIFNKAVTPSEVTTLYNEGL